MKPLFEKVTVNSKHSFALKEEILPYIEIGWHIHPEYELTLFTESSGQMCIGDQMTTFQPGSILLIGPNVPHFMRNDPMYYDGKPELRIRAIVVHFSSNFLGDSFFQLPELEAIRELLQRAKRGIYKQVNLDTDLIAANIEDLLNVSGYKRLRKLLDVLFDLSHDQTCEQLVSIGFKGNHNEDDMGRINKVYDYLLKHFDRNVQLPEVAGLLNMKPSTFCKFFKKRTGKTFSQSLNEIRIGHACKMFINEQLSVSQVCYESGYNSLSYFNRKFKSVTGFAPLTYKKMVEEKANF